MSNVGWEACIYMVMFGLPIVMVILLIAIVIIDIKRGIESKKQQERFAKLYKMCIEKHGLAFAKMVYEGCTKPLWIGMDNIISVFEHHCGIQNKLS